jgi:hypothetical protein
VFRRVTFVSRKRDGRTTDRACTGTAEHQAVDHREHGRIRANAEA